MAADSKQSVRDSAATRFPADLNAPRLPAPNRLSAIVNRIHERWPEAGAPVERDPDAVLVGLSRRHRANDWANCTVAEVLRGAHVVFDAPYRTRIRHFRLRRFLIHEVGVSRIAAFAGGMTSVYLATFEPGGNHTRDLGNALSKARPNLGPRWSAVLANHPELFDSRRAHERIARRMRSMHDPWRELKDSGIRSPHGPGLMSHVHLSYLEQIGDRLTTREGIDRLVRWLKPNEGEAKIGGAAEAIEAFLRPWITRAPTDEFRQHLVDQIVRLYGDPRVRRRMPWSQVGDRYKILLRRWLTRENIVFFLDVVSEVNVSHMWQARREFWLGLYEQGQIDDAWVAFSPAGARRAKRSGLGGGRGLSFGRQVPRPNTSLLILQIGKCIVVEGSHNYKVQFFKSSNRHAPRLFETEYDCDDIRHLSDEDQVHLGDWQSRVLEKLSCYS